MHIGFDVSSMEKSMAFYRDTLECAEFWRGSRDEPPTLERHGVLNHFGLEVHSVPAAMEEVSRRMEGPSREFPRKVEYNIGKFRHRLANVFDPDGTRA